MALYTASINSGSNGNCYYVGTATEAVLIDAGISCREIERRMKRMNLPVHHVKAIFVSHEHSDHIKGVEVFSKRNNLPVYINEKTLRAGGLKLKPELMTTFRHGEVVTVGDLRIKAFKKHHDAADPFSFTVSGHGLTVGVFTDIGHACEEVISHFKECHAAFLETNYDAEMLDNGHYPPHLKRRIKSDKGHLSNNQALELFKQHRHAQLSHLFLSHLSAENNSPALVDQLFRQHAGNTNIIVASRHYESSVYNITGRLGEEERLQMPENVRMSSMKDNAAPVNLSAQLSLF